MLAARRKLPSSEERATTVLVRADLKKIIYTRQIFESIEFMCYCIDQPLKITNFVYNLGFSWPYLSKKERKKTKVSFSNSYTCLKSIFVLFEKEKSIPIQIKGNYNIACSQWPLPFIGLENEKNWRLIML